MFAKTTFQMEGNIKQQRKDIEIEFDCQFKLNLQSSDFSSIMKAFLMLLPQVLEDFFQKVLVAFGEYEMALKQKSFACNCCGNDTEFVWKTRHGKATKILTVLRWITLKQLQVQCKKCGSKMYITRKLLGMEPMKRIPDETRRKFALIGALTSYRVSEKIGKMFGWAVDKMTIWRSVQQVGAEMDFVLDENEEPHGEADGTGVGIKGIAKRGKELKVLVQYKKGGGIRVAGIDIGNYNGSWDKLFQKSIEVIKTFKRPFLLLTDGDTSIFESLKGKVEILIQRCLWHIPYQAKYVLWEDGVKRKSDEWYHVVAELLEICSIRPLVDCQDTIRAMIASKRKRLEQIIEYCREKGYSHTISYLENARGDMFTAIENRLEGKTTSRVERLFRTVNMRVNVSKWSKKGALNITKVRLAYYYNGFDA
jgi:Zn finger protein HypA/HybF involved in hydrogenase expression